jgi:hypothetical protein
MAGRQPAADRQRLPLAAEFAYRDPARIAGPAHCAVALSRMEFRNIKVLCENL